MEQLALLTTQRVMKKRAQGSLRLRVGPGLELSVKLHTLLREADKTRYVYLDAVSAFPCVCRTRWVCEDTGQHLRPQQIKKVFPLGDRKVAGRCWLGCGSFLTLVPRLCLKTKKSLRSNLASPLESRCSASNRKAL